jgi:hypothetical protein
MREDEFIAGLSGAAQAGVPGLNAGGVRQLAEP